MFDQHMENNHRCNDLNGTRTEVEDKVREIMNIITAEYPETLTDQEGQPLENSKNERVIALVEDLHSMYQSLYIRYHHLESENLDSSLESSSENKEQKGQVFVEIIDENVGSKNELFEISAEKDQVYNQGILLSMKEKYEELESGYCRKREDVDNVEEEIENLVSRFHDRIQSNEQKGAEIENMIRSLKRDLDFKIDELASLTEKVHSLEVQLRLSNQKLRVTEQLLAEKEETYQNKEETSVFQYKLLESKFIELSKDVGEDYDRVGRVLCEMLQQLEKFAACISRTSNEVREVRDWVRENVKEREELSGIVDELRVKEREAVGLREEVGYLRMRVGDVEKKCKELQRVMREKDAGMIGLGEEKRQAIRQLCIWIEYYRTRYEYCRGLISRVKASDLWGF